MIANVSMALTAKEMEMERECEPLYEVALLIGGPNNGKYYRIPTDSRIKFRDDPSERYKFGSCVYRPCGAQGTILRLEFVGKWKG